MISNFCPLAAVLSLGFTALRSGNALEHTAKAISLVSVVNGCFAKNLMVTATKAANVASALKPKL